MELKNVGSDFNPEVLSEIENAIGFIMPEDYKTFLKANNGGTPIGIKSISFYETDTETGKQFQNGCLIHSFNRVEDIESFYNNLVGADVVSEGYLPIADDSCGNEVLICLHIGENYGYVYFGDHEMYDSDETHWHLTKIASSFSEFLNLLWDDSKQD